jgi:hypothetical protein
LSTRLAKRLKGKGKNGMFVSLNQVVYNERERERSGNESKTMGIV